MVALAIKPMPLAEAARKFGRKTAVGSVLRSAEWAKMPLALRERALFSAGVESARVLDGMQKRLNQALAMARDETAATMNRERFIVEMRRIAAAEGLGSRGEGDWRDIKDITGAARLGMVWDRQIGEARGYARREFGLTAGALDAVPAQELVRKSPRRTQRDWHTRWAEAGGPGPFAGVGLDGIPGRLVALSELVRAPALPLYWSLVCQHNSPNLATFL